MRVFTLSVFVFRFVTFTLFVHEKLQVALPLFINEKAARRDRTALEAWRRARKTVLLP